MAIDLSDIFGQDDAPPRLRTGDLSPEWMHDLALRTAYLSRYAAHITGLAERGGDAADAMRALVREVEGLDAMVRDVYDGAGAQASKVHVVAAVDSAVNRLHLMSPDLVVEVRHAVQEGVCVAGRASFLARTLDNLLRYAANHARKRITVTIEPCDVAGESGVCVSIVDDGGVARGGGDAFVGGARIPELTLLAAETAAGRLGGHLELSVDRDDGHNACRVRVAG